MTDPIPFVKISAEEAKTALQSETASIAKAKKNWAPDRLTETGKTEELKPTTFRWLAALPTAKRPDALVRHFPRIANRLAEVWKWPVQCERYLDELMMDNRGDRRGFPPDVAADIASLKSHFLGTSSTVRYNVWGDRIGVD